MIRIKGIMSYAGVEFKGFQTQPGLCTVQTTLANALTILLKSPVTIQGAGRTDTGVNALAFPFHFDIEKNETLLKKVTHKNFLYQLNCILPDSIKIHTLTHDKKSQHSRRDSHSKTYTYYFGYGDKPNPFLIQQVWWLKGTHPGLQRLQEGFKILIGTHDFQAFCASDSTANQFVRTIYDIKLKRVRHPFLQRKEYLHAIDFTGSGFLKQMVRILMGTLIDVAQEQTTLSQLKHILKSKDRRLAGKTAPALGLYLKNVSYIKKSL